MSMVNIVAEAIWNRLGRKSHPDATSFAQIPEHVKELFREDARVVLKAMRQPTIEMRMAGMDLMLNRPVFASSNGIWMEMIDAALAGK